MLQQNCWSFCGCGMHTLEASGGAGHGLCPAATEKRLNGANGGLNGGRACWVVDGTLCKGAQQASFMTKLTTCRGCEFHALVRKEAGEDYVSSTDLLKRLRDS